ncbi:MAG TPA: flavodoxin [Pseudobacteroides sp.]|uniref:flavodoxin family protein n=1 Tax=Pseudobacteroides sp. TaxID=1968840 RepID=UPI002F957DE1
MSNSTNNRRILIVYYTQSGNSKFVAETIAQEIKADTLEIKTKKSLPKSTFFKLFVGGMQVVFKIKPDLLPVDKKPMDYDMVIIGTPVWASSFASPFNTFFSQIDIKGKKIALYCCYGGSKGKTFDNMKNVLNGNQFIGELEIKSPLEDKSEGIRRIKEWVKTINI